MPYPDKTQSIPLYQQLYETLKAEILSQNRKPGEKLPAIRAYARTMGVSVSTVVEAYALLASEGYIVSRKGSGHFVRKLDTIIYRPHPSAASPMPPEPEQKVYRFRMNPAIFDRNLISLRSVRRMLDDSMAKTHSMRYAGAGEPFGSPAFRKSIADQLQQSMGFHCTYRQIIVTSALHQCFNILSKELKQVHGVHMIGVENPSPKSLRIYLESNDIRTVPLPISSREAAIRELHRTGCKVLLLMPNHQIPTGSFLPLEERIRLLNWANQEDGLIIEFDDEAGLRYHGKPVQTLKSLDRTDRVIYIGSTRNTYLPGLRTHYLVLPENWYPSMSRRFALYSPNIPSFLQDAYQQMVSSGDWNRHLRHLNTQFAKRHNTFTELLQQKLSPDYELLGTGAGIFFRIRSLRGRSEEWMIRRADSVGVQVFPVSDYWDPIDTYRFDQVLLGFAHYTSEDLTIVSGLLQQAWM